MSQKSHNLEKEYNNIALGVPSFDSTNLQQLADDETRYALLNFLYCIGLSIYRGLLFSGCGATSPKQCSSSQHFIRVCCYRGQRVAPIGAKKIEIMSIHSSCTGLSLCPVVVTWMEGLANQGKLVLISFVNYIHPNSFHVLSFHLHFCLRKQFENGAPVNVMLH